jgi:hypothetical protein
MIAVMMLNSFTSTVVTLADFFLYPLSIPCSSNSLSIGKIPAGCKEKIPVPDDLLLVKAPPFGGELVALTTRGVRRGAATPSPAAPEP